MAIKIVINGYYRSGTTFIYNLLKDSLKDYTCFYEPLNPDLPNEALNESKSKSKNKIHKSFLWAEYNQLSPGVKEKILRCNPNLKKEGINNDSEVIQYLDCFNSLKKPVLLQPNRLHFFLDTIAENYNPKIIHIIRHPLDVFLSMEKMYIDSSNSNFQKFIKFLFKPFMFQFASGFDLNKEYNWIRKHTGYPMNNSWGIKYFNKFDSFGKFLVVWTISNYLAIQSVNRNNGLIVSYDKLVLNPKNVAQSIENYLNIKIDNINQVKKGNSNKYPKKLVQKMHSKIQKYGLESEFNYVLSQLNE